MVDTPRHEQGSTEHGAFVEGYMESVPAIAAGTQPVTIPQGQWTQYRDPKGNFHPAMTTGQIDSVTVWAALFFEDHLAFHKCVMGHDATHGQYLRDA